MCAYTDTHVHRHTLEMHTYAQHTYTSVCHTNPGLWGTFSTHSNVSASQHVYNFRFCHTPKHGEEVHPTLMTGLWERRPGTACWRTQSPLYSLTGPVFLVDPAVGVSGTWLELRAMPKLVTHRGAGAGLWAAANTSQAQALWVLVSP
jgi:hypothetical protein